MGVAISTYHSVGHEILQGCRVGLDKLRNLLKQVLSRLLIHPVGKVTEGRNHAHAVAGTFIPNIVPGIETVVCQLLHAPLADAVAVDDIVKIVFSAFPVGIFAVSTQYKRTAKQELRLVKVPVVVWHSV